MSLSYKAKASSNFLFCLEVHEAIEELQVKREVALGRSAELLHLKPSASSSELYGEHNAKLAPYKLEKKALSCSKLANIFLLGEVQYMILQVMLMGIGGGRIRK